MPSDHYLLSDLLYRSRALTDDVGAIEEAYDTDAYGNTIIFESPGTGGDWWADDAVQTFEPMTSFIFTGRRIDSEAAIYYFRARYYVAAEGRFIGRDPAGIDGSESLYWYTGDNPVRFIDWNGLDRVQGPTPRAYPPQGSCGSFVLTAVDVEYSKHEAKHKASGYQAEFIDAGCCKPPKYIALIQVIKGLRPAAVDRLHGGAKMKDYLRLHGNEREHGRPGFLAPHYHLFRTDKSLGGTEGKTILDTPYADHDKNATASLEICAVCVVGQFGTPKNFCDLLCCITFTFTHTKGNTANTLGTTGAVACNLTPSALWDEGITHWEDTDWRT